MLSCIPEISTKVKSNIFFDINGLIDEQIKLLDSINPSVFKKANIDGKEEVSEIKPTDSSEWSKELAIFKAIDLNRSILVDSYDIEKSSTNLNFTRYISRYPEDTEVDTLTIEFYSDQNPKRIKAYLEAHNELFQSSKTLDMQFTGHNDISIISAYRIEGWQKMISKDSIWFLIQGTILQP